MVTKLRRWISAPTFEGNDEKTLSATLLNLIIWIFIIAASLYGWLAPIEPELRGQRAVIIIPYVLVMLVLKLLVNWGYVRLTGALIVISLWAIFTGAMFFGADYHNPAFMGYLVVVICAGLILNRQAAVGWGFISILTSGILLRLGQAGILPPSVSATPAYAFWTAQTVYILTTIFLLTQTLRKMDESRTRAQQELKERKRVEAEREHIIRELEMKNAELERFTYTVSHDLKSPLITIGGFVGLLEADARAGNISKLKRDLARIREAKDKMDRLLNELLELSRIGRLINPPRSVPFAEIVKEALALTRGRLMMGHVQVDVAKDLPIVHGDRQRLVEVLQNLIDNAAKFMGDQPKPHIEIGMREKKGRNVFFVKDNGMGIEPKFHERIFALFDKLDPKSEGTGVGLSLVKRIIEVHDGRIWVESEGKGQGSTFCFTLPIVGQ